MLTFTANSILAPKFTSGVISADKALPTTSQSNNEFVRLYEMPVAAVHSDVNRRIAAGVRQPERHRIG